VDIHGVEREEGGRGKEKKRGWPRERREINPLSPFHVSAPGHKSILSLFAIFFVA
jgi:hypothetical protein